MDQPPQYQVVGYTVDGQPVYGDGPLVYGTGSSKTNGLAIATLVLSLVLGFVAIPFGHVAKSQIRRTGEQGSGLATAGLVLGYLSLTVAIALGSFIAYTVHQASSAAAAARSYTQAYTPPYNDGVGSSSGGTGTGGPTNGGSTNGGSAPTGQYYYTTTPTPTASTGTGASAAAAMNMILSQSGAARSAVVAATQAVGNCTGDPLTEAGHLQSVVSQRQSELQQLNAIPTNALPGGSALIGYLTTALQASNQADQDYIGWMQAVAGQPCPYPTTSEPHFVAAAGASSQASAAKASFVALWNPLAAQLNLPQYAENQI